MKQTRARDEQAKAARRKVILKAAATLFERQGCLPSVAAVASQAGLAKGTVYLYFESKELVFISLLEDEFSRWLDSVIVAVDGCAGDWRSVVLEMTRLFRAQRNFLNLACLCHTVLEQGEPTAELLAYKKRLAAHMGALGASFAANFPLRPDADVNAMLMQSYALIIGLWQIANPPQALHALLDDSGLQVLVPDFYALIETGIGSLWQSYMEGESG